MKRSPESPTIPPSGYPPWPPDPDLSEGRRSYTTPWDTIRHQLIFNAEKVAGEPEPKRADVWNFLPSFGDEKQWQMIHNMPLRAYLQGLPYWGFHFDLRSTLFTSRCFHALKAARLTGLIENTAERSSQHSEEPPYNPWEMIGHID